jgi:hypothetical protein
MNIETTIFVLYLVGNEDPAIGRLNVHFTSVIHNILTGTWIHFLPTSVIKTKLDKKIYGMYLNNLAGCLTYDTKPRVLWIGEVRLKDRIFALRDKVSKAMLYSLITSL